MTDKNTPKDDVVWNNIDVEQGDDISLEPIDPGTTAARQSRREMERPKLPAEVVEESPRFQFTIKHMLIANAVVAVSFGLMQWIAPSGLAGLLGMIAFISGLVIAAFKPDSRAIQVAWWSLLGLYAMSCLFAACSL